MSPLVSLPVIEGITVTADSNHTACTSFYGFSVRETASAAAVVNFRDGSVTGDFLAVISLAADEAALIVFGGSHMSPSGVYIEVASGAIEGVLYNAK